MIHRLLWVSLLLFIVGACENGSDVPTLEAGVQYEPNYVPLVIRFNNRGEISFRASSGKLPTPLGTFSIYANASFLDRKTLTVVSGGTKHVYDLHGEAFRIYLPNDRLGQSEIDYDGAGNIVLVIPEPDIPAYSESDVGARVLPPNVENDVGVRVLPPNVIKARNSDPLCASTGWSSYTAPFACHYLFYQRDDPREAAPTYGIALAGRTIRRATLRLYATLADHYDVPTPYCVDVKINGTSVGAPIPLDGIAHGTPYGATFTNFAVWEQPLPQAVLQYFRDGDNEIRYSLAGAGTTCTQALPGNTWIVLRWSEVEIETL